MGTNKVTESYATTRISLTYLLSGNNRTIVIAIRSGKYLTCIRMISASKLAAMAFSAAQVQGRIWRSCSPLGSFRTRGHPRGREVRNRQLVNPSGCQRLQLSQQSEKKTVGRCITQIAPRRKMTGSGRRHFNGNICGVKLDVTHGHAGIHTLTHTVLLHRSGLVIPANKGKGPLTSDHKISTL